jgi:hypothetical protein
MGEGTTRVDDAESTERLEREVEDLRENLTGIVGELDRRRHEILDWRFQLQRNRLVLALAVGSLALVTTGVVAAEVRRRKSRNRPMAKARRFRDAVSRMIERPDQVARAEPSAAGRLLASLVTGAAGFAARRLAAQWATGVGERIPRADAHEPMAVPRQS